MTPFESLQDEHKWPAESPVVPDRIHGWFYEANQDAISRFLPTAKTAIELGSWFGMSAMWMVKGNPDLKLVCIDHWTTDPAEDTSIAEKDLFAKAHDGFLCNLWPWRDRVVPMRSKTAYGLVGCYAHKFEPDFVYVDAGHDYESAFTDLALCARLFPKAGLCGDDWISHPGVRRAIEEVCAAQGWKPVQTGNAWYVDK